MVMFQQVFTTTSKSSIEQQAKISCFYLNDTSQIQIIRINNTPDMYWEKVVFPGQRLIFEATPEARLKIYSSRNSFAILSDVISCQQLMIHSEER